MGEEPVRRISSSEILEVDDPILDAWDDLEPASEAAYRAVPERDPNDPFDVEVAKPRLISIEKLYALGGRAVPAQLQAGIGDGTPVLVCHGMTPFYKPGRRPTGVWGMGYRSELNEPRCSSVAVFPESRKYDVIETSQVLSCGIKLGGEIGIPEAKEAERTHDVSGITITGATVRAMTDQQFGIVIKCRFSVLEIQAGPVGSGGARWNFYRSRESVESYQPLFQTIVVPRDVSVLTFKVETWIRRSGRFFGLVKGRHWAYPPQTFDVALEG
jgi:hypothetical protein